MKSKLMKHKNKLIAGLASLALGWAVLELGSLHNKRVELAEVKGCNKVVAVMTNPLLMAHCDMRNKVLVIKVGLTGQIFDAETGHELPRD
jgi:hypothetical protein